MYSSTVLRFNSEVLYYLYSTSFQRELLDSYSTSYFSDLDFAYNIMINLKIYNKIWCIVIDITTITAYKAVQIKILLTYQCINNNNPLI